MPRTSFVAFQGLSRTIQLVHFVVSEYTPAPRRGYPVALPPVEPLVRCTSLSTLSPGAPARRVQPKPLALALAQTPPGTNYELGRVVWSNFGQARREPDTGARRRVLDSHAARTGPSRAAGARGA